MFSVLGYNSQFAVHCSLFTFHCSLFTEFASRLTLHGSRLTLHLFLFTVHFFIADAGSNDKTLEIIQSFTDRGSLKIKVVEGGYPPTGRNMGASYCRSEYILFLDADIELGEDTCIEKSINLALEKNHDLVTTYIKCKDGNQYDKVFWEKIMLSLIGILT
jgi:hypothetical protein